MADYGGILQALMNAPQQAAQGMGGILGALMNNLGVPQGDVRNAKGDVVFPTNQVEKLLQASDAPTKQAAMSFAGAPKNLRPIPVSLSLMAEDRALGRNFSLVDQGGTPHYKASVTFPGPSDLAAGLPADLAGIGWIENTSRQFSGLGPSFYREIANSLPDRRLIVGASASPSAVRAHGQLEGGGYAQPINPDSLYPGLKAKADAAGERLLEVLMGRGPILGMGRQE